MKRSSIVFRILAMGTIGAAVGSCRPAEPPPEPRLRVRLLTSVSISGRWERAAERGLGLIAAELGAEVARIRSAGLNDQRSKLRSLACQGVDLVFCVGPDIESMVYTEAVAFPDTYFVAVPGRVQSANVGSVTFLPEEAGYLAGAVAACMTEHPEVGLLRGAGRPWLESLESGFVAGFRSRRSGAAVIIVNGPEGPWRLTTSGVEVALYATDLAEPEVLAAAHDAGLYLIGADPDLMRAEPDFVVAAVDIDVAEAMLRVAREVNDRSFQGRVFAFDLGSGVVGIELNPGLTPGDRGPDLHDAVERARSEITAGWVEIEELGIAD
jgi:basic membrane protein A